MASMSDALAASTLVTAVLVALFTLWQGEISKALAAPESDDSANRTESKRLVRSVLMFRALPLFVVTGATLLILSVRVGRIVTNVFSCAHEKGCRYDDVSAMMALTEVLILVLWFAVLAQVGALGDKLVDLNKA